MQKQDHLYNINFCQRLVCHHIIIIQKQRTEDTWNIHQILVGLFSG